MESLVGKIATAATLGVAILPWIALSVGHAQPVTVRVSDLNLSRPAQVQVFNGRVARAAERVCAGYADPRSLTLSGACKDGVRAEVQDKLAERRAQQGAVTIANR